MFSFFGLCVAHGVWGVPGAVITSCEVTLCLCVVYGVCVGGGGGVPCAIIATLWL